MIFAAAFQESLNLECLVPSVSEEWDIKTADVNRPGMQFCDFYTHFPYERPQVIGNVEMSYLQSQTHEQRTRILEKYLSYPIPCVIICRGLETPEELLDIAAEHGVAVYRTKEVTSRLSAKILKYLNRILAPHEICHGVLLDVFGQGIFLRGRSGVGKSEAALELIKRGHQLVADDVVDICKISEDRLIGVSPDPIRHYMEIRGLGLIDVRALYGIGAVSASKSIDLIIELESWDEKKDYDRIGLTEQFAEIMGVSVPLQIMPVGPGRNLAVIIEVAARNLSLRRSGYNSARELMTRLSTFVFDKDE